MWIGPVELAGFGPSTDWWNQHQSGVIGATGGILAGLSGAALGILGGRRKNWRVLEAVLIGGAAIGVVLIVVAVVAFSGGQPRHVWYPVGLLGTILALIDGLLIPIMRRNYIAAELHRISALDA